VKTIFLTLFLFCLLAGCKQSYKKMGEPLTTEPNNTSKGITLNAKVCLEGAFIETPSMMRPKINEDLLLPRISPYTGLLPWNHQSPNDLVLPTSIYNLYSLVDWVIVQVYQDVNGVKTFKDSQSGFISKNGKIFDSSGLQGIVFPDLQSGEYYVNIIHRNHLAIGSLDAVSIDASFSPEIYNIDFTSLTTDYLGSNNFVELGTSPVKCMLAGDIDGDLDIDTDDETAFQNSIKEVVTNPAPDTQIIGYNRADLNLDGQARQFNDAGATDESDDFTFITTTNKDSTGEIHHE
jgi:hypothetical protein